MKNLIYTLQYWESNWNVVLIQKHLLTVFLKKLQEKHQVNTRILYKKIVLYRFQLIGWYPSYKH